MRKNKNYNMKNIDLIKLNIAIFVGLYKYYHIGNSIRNSYMNLFKAGNYFHIPLTGRYTQKEKKINMTNITEVSFVAFIWDVFIPCYFCFKV